MGWQHFLECLFPDYHYNSFSEIPFRMFWDMGYRGIISDRDDTLTSHHGHHIHETAQQGVESMVELGFKTCVLTNCSQEIGEQARTIVEPYGFHVIVPKKRKPFKEAFEEAVNYLNEQGVSKEKIIMIGDHLATDILGANNYGLTSILVNPISGLSLKHLDVFGFRVLNRIGYFLDYFL